MNRIFVILFMLSYACGNAALGKEEEHSLTDAEPRYEVLLNSSLPLSPDSPVLRPDFSNADYEKERSRMVRRQIALRGVENDQVLEAMREVPRHLFVHPSTLDRAYGDYPLPIGHGQTISQPYIVGLMTELLELEKGDIVLEVGTGSGYQAAILARIIREVVSIEIVAPLARKTSKSIAGMDFTNILLLHGDGYFGYSEKAPYDAIIVTAAADHIPPPLVTQLKPGGRMIIPVGPSGWTQNLVLVKKSGTGKITTRNILPVRFVPLTRGKQ